LAGVIVQGLLGGFRVRFDERFLAMFHGAFGAVVFAVFVLIAMATSRTWISYRVPITDSRPKGLLPLLCFVPALIVVQYSLGGMVRHLGLALYEHLFFAAAVWLTAHIAAVVAIRSGEKYLYGTAYSLAAAATLQVVIGIGAWVTKYGLASQGYVAVQHSTEQVLFRSAHTVVGMFLLSAAVCLAARAFKLSAIGWKPAAGDDPDHSGYIDAHAGVASAVEDKR